MSEPVLDRSLLPAGYTVLCAVSGGADSVCLLDLVRRLGDVTVLCAHPAGATSRRMPRQTA